MSAKHSITNEPLGSNTMDFYHAEEKQTALGLPPSYYELSQQQEDLSSSHECPDARRCHASRLRRVFLWLSLIIVSLGVIFALACVMDACISGEGVGGLLKRATDATTSSSGGSTFTNRKRPSNSASLFIHQLTSI